ncbi:hypothetical protein C4K18_3928 [Pseudomonas chlororaphis subsp. aurantiaca]|nr:hypothetical protein C4K18_3928 [Pseudomonas chlororaphis subsp. aurantiaca]
MPSLFIYQVRTTLSFPSFFDDFAGVTPLFQAKNAVEKG